MQVMLEEYERLKTQESQLTRQGASIVIPSVSLPLNTSRAASASVSENRIATAENCRLGLISARQAPAASAMLLAGYLSRSPTLAHQHADSADARKLSASAVADVTLKRTAITNHVLILHEDLQHRKNVLRQSAIAAYHLRVNDLLKGADSLTHSLFDKFPVHLLIDVTKRGQHEWLPLLSNYRVAKAIDSSIFVGSKPSIRRPVAIGIISDLLQTRALPSANSATLARCVMEHELTTDPNTQVASVCVDSASVNLGHKGGLVQLLKKGDALRYMNLVTHCCVNHQDALCTSFAFSKSIAVGGSGVHDVLELMFLLTRTLRRSPLTREIFHISIRSGIISRHKVRLYIS